MAPMQPGSPWPGLHWHGGDRPLGEDAAEVLASVDAWVTSEPLASLVAAFDGQVPQGSSASALLAWLSDFSTRWDFRGGRERNLARPAGLSAAQERLVLELAPLLGLAPSRPSRSHYDVVVMTGGMVWAGIVKPRYLRELLDAGLSVGEAVFLGGFRPFGGSEVETARVVGVAGNNEFDAMLAGMGQAFGPLGPPRRAGTVPLGEPGGNASWLELGWPAATGAVGEPRHPALRVLAAPSSEPEARRANTVDTYRFWAEHRRAAGQRSVLVITTPIYVPYQAAGAVEVLGADYGLAVEAVGVSAIASDLGAHSQPCEAQHHLQELRSAIRGFESLRIRMLRPG